MPQLDASTFVSQLVWLCIAFGILWTGLAIMLPGLQTIFKKRNRHVMQALRQARELEKKTNALLASNEAGRQKAQKEARKKLEEAASQVQEALSTFRAQQQKEDRVQSKANLDEMTTKQKQRLSKITEKNQVLVPIFLERIRRFYRTKAKRSEKGEGT